MIWRGLIALVALGLVCATVGSEPRQIEVEDRAMLVATLPCERNLQATASGYLVGDELVVTVAHAVFESREVAARDHAGRWYDAQIVHIDLARDLALLRVRGARSTPAHLAPAALDASDPVRMIDGATSGTVAGDVTRRVRITTNVVGGDEKSQRSGYELDLPIGVGDSGAAVVNDRDELAAVVFAQSTRRQGVSWATAASEVSAVLGQGDSPGWACDRDFGRSLERNEQGRP